MGGQGQGAEAPSTEIAESGVQLDERKVRAFHGGPSDRPGSDEDTLVLRIDEVVEFDRSGEGQIVDDAVSVEADAMAGGKKPRPGSGAGGVGGVNEGAGAG